MTDLEFAKISSTLAAAYPAANISMATIEIYFNELQDLDFLITQTAIKKIISVSKFYPSIAEIRGEYFDIISPQMNLRSEEAIKILDTAIRDYGRIRVIEAMEYIKNKSEALYIVIKSIGFINICNSDSKIYRLEIEKLFKETAGGIKKKLLLTDETKKRILQIQGKMKFSASLIEESYSKDIIDK